MCNSKKKKTIDIKKKNSPNDPDLLIINCFVFSEVSHCEVLVSSESSSQKKSSEG